MKTSGLDPPGKYAPFFDVDQVTERSIQVFFADRSLETFGWCGAGWFWWLRRRGFAPQNPARGPFPTSYSAYWDALHSVQRRQQYSFFGLRLQPGCNDDAGTKSRVLLEDVC